MNEERGGVDGGGWKWIEVNERGCVLVLCYRCNYNNILCSELQYVLCSLRVGLS